MNTKGIILIATVLMIIISSGAVSAGWFDSTVETDSFKFECPGGFSGSGENSTAILTKDSNSDYIIAVGETDRDNYTGFVNKDFSVSKSDDGTFSTLSTAKLQKDIKEDNMRIVVRHAGSLGITNAVIHKDSSYYFVMIQHPYHTEEITEDIEIVRGIESSIEEL